MSVLILWSQQCPSLDYTCFLTFRDSLSIPLRRSPGAILRQLRAIIVPLQVRRGHSFHRCMAWGRPFPSLPPPSAPETDTSNKPFVQRRRPKRRRRWTRRPRPRLRSPLRRSPFTSGTVNSRVVRLGFDRKCFGKLGSHLVIEESFFDIG